MFFALCIFLSQILARGLNRVVKGNYVITIRPNMAFEEIKFILLIQFAKYLVSTGLIFLPFLSGFCDHFNNILIIMMIIIIIIIIMM